MENEVIEAPADLTLITKQAAKLKDEIAKLESEIKARKEQYTEVCNNILHTLDLMDLDSIRAHGYLFFKEMRSSVTTPKTLEDKEKLFNWLKEKAIFMEIVSVNSQTLNSLYKNLSEDAAKEGILDFQIPGVANPTTYTTLKLKKG